ncbi:MAG: hypothetical protein WCJ82_05110 [Actinomycetota bacterium]
MTQLFNIISILRDTGALEYHLTGRESLEPTLGGHEDVGVI